MFAVLVGLVAGHEVDEVALPDVLVLLFLFTLHYYIGSGTYFDYHYAPFDIVDASS